jgi:hypothetical protein
MTCLENSRPGTACRYRALAAVLLLALATVPEVPACQVDEAAIVPPDSRDAIASTQARLTGQYRLLEDKLFSLYQYEQDQNPERSRLLEEAWQLSQQQLTLKQLESALQMMEQSRLRDAEKHQASAIENLKKLLELLQSGDRGARIREDRDQYRDFLKQVERIQRMQQGIRGRTESKADPGDPESDTAAALEQQRDIARQTAELNSRICEKTSPEGAGLPKADSDPAGDAESGASPDAGKESQEAEGETALARAQRQMEQAQQALQESQREQAIESMRNAERELAHARQELDRILRQLRQEEIQRSLTSLESRFRQMMEFQLKIQDETRRLDLKKDNASESEVQIESGRLAGNERELVDQADRALLVLEDDGSSIATIESLRQVQTDMQQLVSRLNASRTGAVTQQIEEDVIEMLGQMIKAFETAQRDMNQDDSASQDPSDASAGQQALIDQLAELKLIRSLQQRILQRHKRYAALLNQPDDELGYSDDPEIREALANLAGRQTQLFEITRDIVTEQNRRQSGEGDLP